MLAMDYDRDGDEDLLVVGWADVPRLYRNDQAEAADWLTVDVRGRQGEPFLNARVDVMATDGGVVQSAQTGVGSHFVGHGPHELYFGLGDSGPSVAELRVVWPDDGSETVLSDLEANQRIVVVRD
jgi:hypothetical protein